MIPGLHLTKAVTNINFSPDGTKVLIGTSASNNSGDEGSVYSIATGQRLGGTIADIFGASWTDKSRSLTRRTISKSDSMTGAIIWATPDGRIAEVAGDGRTSTWSTDGTRSITGEIPGNDRSPEFMVA